MENVWEKALLLLKSEVNDQIFSSWFSPIRQFSVADDVLTLAVPNKFFENWIRENYENDILSAIRKTSGRAIQLKFIATETAATRAAEKPEVKAPADSGTQPAVDAPKKSDAMGWFKNVFTPPRPSAPESQYQKIGLNPKYSFDSFVVGQSNRFAHAAALAISENPAKTYNPLFIHGGVGLGKTHLLHAIGNRILELFPKSRILFISSEEFTNQLITAIRTRSQSNFRNMYRNVDVLLIDDIQFIAGKESTQEEFFHTFNRLYDSHNQIVLSSDRSPKEIPKLEERLVSRFDWGLRADIQPPDFETRTAIFEKKCELESIDMPHDVIFFLAEKVRANIREMEGALIRVVAYASLTGNKLTVDLAKEILKDMILEEEKKISLDSIQEAIADHFNISVKELKSRKRTQAVAYPRQIAMYLARELTSHSLPEIGASMGDRDHTTVLHAVDKIKRDLSTNSNLKGLLDKLTARIKNRN